jgi:hypothetical protein
MLKNNTDLILYLSFGSKTSISPETFHFEPKIRPDDEST